MDPDRRTPTPPTGSNSPAYAIHPSDVGRRSSFVAGTVSGASTLPSLPSIHQLHPDLPSTSMSVHRLPMVSAHSFSSGYDPSSGFGQSNRVFALDVWPLTLEKQSIAPLGISRRTQITRMTIQALRRRSGGDKHSAAQVIVVLTIIFVPTTCLLC